MKGNKVKDRIFELFHNAVSWVKKHLLISIVLLVLAILVIYFAEQRIIGNTSWADWTGFGNYTGTLPKDDRGKTLWDWMSLFLVPIFVSIGAALAAGIWSYIQQKAEDKRMENQQNEEAMRSYFDKIGQLMIEKELLKTQNAEQGTKEAAIRDYAQILTITAIRSLDRDRKNIIFQFLRDAKLAEFLLSHASLGHSDLKYTNMNKINLSCATLFMAQLTGTNLEKADLTGADLVDAILIWAHLSEADLTGADLILANLNGADLKEANLTESKLIGADLSKASLTGANLSKADLTAATVTDEQLLKAASLKGTTKPDGSIHE